MLNYFSNAPLAIENDEWRLNPSLAFADVLLLRAYPNDAEEKEHWKNYNPLNKWEHLKWIDTGNSNAIKLRGWQSKEAEFMKIDNSAKEFYIDTDSLNQTRLKAGTYQFIVKVIMRETKLNIRNGFPSIFRLNRAFSITVKYDGINLNVEENRDATNDESHF